MDLREACSFHMLALNAEGASLVTQRNYLHYWRKLLAYCDELHIGVELELFTPDLLRGAAVWARANGNPAASRGGAVAARQFIQRMNTAGNFLIREQIIPERQFRTVQAPRVAKVLRQPFTQTEVAAMWGACQNSRNPERDEALFLLLLDTGMRIGEANALTLAKLNMESRHAIVGEAGKARRERLVPIGDDSKRDGGRTIRALSRYVAIRPAGRWDHDRLFLSRDGRPLLANSLSNAIQQLGKAAGVRNAIPHRLRHTFCSQYLVMYPGDELGLRRIVGHVSHAVLSDYVHFSQNIIAERSGRVALSEQWLGGRAAPRESQRRQPVRRSASAPAAGRRIADVSLLETLRRDPDLRSALARLVTQAGG